MMGYCSVDEKNIKETIHKMWQEFLKICGISIPHISAR